MNWSRPTPALPAPSLLNNKPVLLGLLVLLLVPFFVPIPMYLRQHPFIGHLGDQVHVPFLMMLTLLIYWRGPLTGRLRYSIAAAMILGGGIEIVQLVVGRSALLADFYLDLAGIGLATGLVLWKGYQVRAGLALMLALVMILSAQLYFLPGLILGSYHSQQNFPLISDFEGTYEGWLWSETYDALVEIVETDDGTVLQLESGPPSRWPGAKMTHFPHNWENYHTLKVDVRNTTPDREKVPFSVRLDDFETRHDQANISSSFKATNQWQTFSIPFANRKVRNGDRMLNLHDMSHILVFLSDKNDSTSIEIDNLRLE